MTKEELLESIIEAQRTNQNMEWYQKQLNDLWYSYSPFKKILIQFKK